MPEVTQTEFARLIGRTTRQVRNLEEHGLPHRAEGNRKLIPVPEAFEWFYGRLFGGDSPESMAEARRRKAVADAEIAEHELRKIQGRTIDLEYADQQLAACLERTRAALNNLPGVIAPRLVGMRSIAKVQVAMRDALDECMPTLQAIGTDPELDDDPPDSSTELAA